MSSLILERVSPTGEQDALRAAHTRLELVTLLGQVASEDRGALLEFVDLTWDTVAAWLRAGIRSQSRREALALAVYVEVWSTAADYDPRGTGVYHWLAETVTRVLESRITD